MSYNKNEDRFRFLSSGSQENSTTASTKATLSHLVESQKGTEGLEEKTKKMEGIKSTQGDTEGLKYILEAKQELIHLNEILMKEISFFKNAHPGADEELKSDASTTWDLSGPRT